MSHPDESRWLRASERWLRATLRLYPQDFRDEMGEALVETYRDRCRAAVRRGGGLAVVGVWLRALGDALRNGVGERVRPAVGWRRSGNWGRDTERAVRRLVRAPAFALSMLATLTVGLGAFAVVFTVVDKVLVEPLPYRQPDDLYVVWRDYTWFDLKRGWLGGTDVVALQQAGGAIEDAAALRRSQATLTSAASESAGGDPEEVGLMVATPNVFPLLGVRPMLGRGFRPEEVGPGRPPVAVLTHDFWRRRFAGDRSVIGREIRLDGERYTVVGVMGPDFHFVRNASLGPPEGADVYVTFQTRLADTDPGAGSYAGLVRARPGTPPQTVATAVAAVGAMVDRRDFHGRGLRLYPVGLEADLVKDVRPALEVLGAAGVLLVLVLAINMASLLLVRAAQREQEFAIVRALGANPVALARATLLEAVLLGTAGGACGALAAAWATHALVALAPADLPRRASIAVDWKVAAIVVGVGALLGLLAGLAPAARATRTRLAALLRDASVRGGGAHGRLRRAMVVAQVALSLVLLSAGGLVARSFQRLLRANPGFDPSGVLTLRVPAPASRYDSAATLLALEARIERELAALPGVTAVGAARALPLTAGTSQSGMSFPGAPGNTGEKDHDEPLVDHTPATPGYFDALGIRVLAGRGFSPAGAPGARTEALIDRTLAERFFPTGSPIGFRLPFGSDTLTVVGVVEHARMYDVHKDGRPQLYYRIELEPRRARALSYAVRTSRRPSVLAPEVREAIRRIDPQLAVSDVRPMDDVVKDRLRQPRVSAVLLAGFSAGALLLAAMGLFGVVAGSVAHRRHELAVRLALGADHRRVLRLVLREGALLVAAGLLLGVPGIYFAGRIIGGVLVGVSPFDPLTLGAVAAGLATVAIAACYVPARRVVGIDPARSLREG